MFDVVVGPDVIEYARNLVGSGAFGRRGIGDGSVEEQVTGLVGQTVIHDLFEIPRPRRRAYSDGGVDLSFEGMSLDVKTMGRTTYPRANFANNLTRLQVHFPTDAYIFCSFGKRTQILTVCGWLTRIEFLEQAVLHPAGTERTRFDGSTFRTRTDLYEVRNHQLHRADSFQEMTAVLSLQAGFFDWARQRALEAGENTCLLELARRDEEKRSGSSIDPRKYLLGEHLRSRSAQSAQLPSLAQLAARETDFTSPAPNGQA